jgi:hypothetical protein
VQTAEHARSKLPGQTAGVPMALDSPPACASESPLYDRTHGCIYVPSTPSSAARSWTSRPTTIFWDGWTAGSAWSGRWRTGSRRDAGSDAWVQADRSKWAFPPEPTQSASRQIDLSVSIRASETVSGRNDSCRQTRPPPFSVSAPVWRRRHYGKGSRTLHRSN